MVRRTPPTKRAVLLNKKDVPTFNYINKTEFSEFLKDFLKSSKKKMASPPTQFEKALIIAKPVDEIKKPAVSNVVLSSPELLDKIRKSLKNKTISKNKIEK